MPGGRGWVLEVGESSLGAMTVLVDDDDVGSSISSSGEEMTTSLKDPKSLVTQNSAVINLKCEPLHDKINKMTLMPSKDADQPGHSASLIRVFTVH